MSVVEWTCLIVLTVLNAALIGLNKHQEHRARKAWDYAHKAYADLFALWVQVQDAEQRRREGQS